MRSFHKPSQSGSTKGAHVLQPQPARESAKMKAVFKLCCFGSKDTTPQIRPRTVAAGSPAAGRLSPHHSSTSTPTPNTRAAPLGVVVQVQPGPTPAVPSQVWKKAFMSLPEHDQQTLDFGTSDRVALLCEVLALTEEKRTLCLQRQWKIPLGGKNINLRETADSLCAHVQKFVLIGDTIIQYDPVHAALPWAAFRFLLQVISGDSALVASIMVALERVAFVLDRCAIYEGLYLPTGGVRDAVAVNLQSALEGLYAAVLRLLAFAKQFYEHNTAARLIIGIFDVVGVQPLLDGIKAEEAEVAFFASQAEAWYQRHQHRLANAQTDKLRSILIELEKPIMRIDRKVSQITDHLQDSYRIEILNWISMVPYKQHHDLEYGGRTENTGHWFLTHDTFQNWRSSSASAMLWLHGIPGAGKTKLMSLVVHVILEDIRTRNNTEGFAYFYCKRDEKDRHDADSIFRAILKQLCSRPGTKALQAPVIREYEVRKQDGFASGTLRLQESKRLIIELLNIYPHSTIVIDGLDECDQAERESILPALQELVDESENLVKLCISSRDEHDIGLSFKHHPNHLIQPSDTTNDIDRYLKLVLKEKISQRKLLNGKVDPALEERIYSTLRGKAHGMFLWVNLQIRMLCSISMRSDIEARLGRLPDTLNKTYQDIFDSRIDVEADNSKRLAHLAMMWIMTSGRPLTPNELVSASVVALRLDTSASNDEEIDIDLILKLCYNLVVVDNQLNVMRFAHLSVQEFLEEHRWATGERNHMAAEVCLLLLINDDSLHFSGREDDANEVEIYFHRNRLKMYASYHWQTHVRHSENATVAPEVHRLLKLFLGSWETPAEAFLEWFQFMEWGEPHQELISKHTDYTFADYLRSDPPTILPTVCHFGINQIVSDLWDLGQTFDVNMRNAVGSTLLSVASGAGHEWITRFLLTHGAEVNRSGGHWSFPLHHACACGHENIVQLLLDYGADKDCTTVIDSIKRPALVAAAYHGHGGVVRILLRREHHHYNIKVPFTMAANSGHLDVLRALVEDPAFATSDMELVCEALQLAADQRQAEAVIFLISLAKKHVDDVRTLSAIGSDAATCAVRGGSIQILRSIFEALPSADLHLRSRIWGKTALHVALESRSRDISDYLISQGANMKLLAHFELGSLQWAKSEPWFQGLKSALSGTTYSLRYTPVDVLRVRAMLRRKTGLPDKLIHAILDHGEVWVHTRQSREETLKVDCLSKRIPYVELPVRSRLDSCVRKLEFCIKSHDQGWGDHRESKGTYHGSWTWFEADLTDDTRVVELTHYPEGREIQRNLTSMQGTRTHIITWDYHDSDSMAAWIGTLPHGRSVGVYPRAVFPGWENTIKQLDMDMYCALG